MQDNRSQSELLYGSAGRKSLHFRSMPLSPARPLARNVLNTPGTAYMGDVLRAAFRDARTVNICVSFLRFSGLNLFLADLQAFVDRGGHLRMLVSTYLNVTQPDALRVLARIAGAGNVRLQDGPDGFHAKVYLFQSAGQTTSCWVGSSNFTKNGLYTSLEWNARHDDVHQVADSQALFEELWNRPDVRAASETVITAYEHRYRASNLVWPVPVLGATGISPAPNPSQQEALRELARLRAAGRNRAAVIAATGLGKTYLAAFDALQMQQERPRQEFSVLFVAHREELLVQAEATFRQLFPGSTTGLLSGTRRPGRPDLVFATVQSLSQGGNAAVLDRAYDYLVVDEFHHAAAPSYERLLSAAGYRFLLGLTATPERVDGQDVLKICDYTVAYEMRLPEAVNRGWLVPFHYFGIADNVEYDAVPWRNGQFDPSQLEHALMLESRTDLIVRHALEKGYDGRRRATVGFCAGVRHTQYMADAFQARGFAAAAVTGQMMPSERQAVYRRFADPADPLEWLFVSDVLNEGVDIPAINSVLFLRPTQSPGLFLQQLGRGLRLYPDTEVLTVLDFVGHHRQALLPLQALDSVALRAVHSHEFTAQDVLDITPPRHCEIILEDQTRRVMLALQRAAAGGWTSKQRIRDAYLRLRDELRPEGEGQVWRRPELMDFWRREDLPEFRDVRRAFGSWLDCRHQLGDADAWEETVWLEAGLAARLLSAAEKDLQAQRAAPYAALWALVHFPEAFKDGLDTFLVRFPQWVVEGPLDPAKALGELQKKPQFGSLIQSGRLIPELHDLIQRDPRLATEVEDRLRYTLARDYQARHEGVLRTPDQTVTYRGYRRGEIANLFGQQYDPSRHNVGVLQVPGHFALLAQLDTRDARAGHQYTNAFTADQRHFSWQSQNRQSPHQGSGQLIVEHVQRGLSIHLFVQGKGDRYVALGPVTVTAVTGDHPFTATLRLSEPLPESVWTHLHGEKNEGD